MMEDRLLYPVYERLRSRGVPLGIAEYREAVAMMRRGLFLSRTKIDDTSAYSLLKDSSETIGPNADLKRLKRLLRLMWAKRQEHLAWVDEAFDEIIAPKLTPASMEEKKEEEEGSERKGGDKSGEPRIYMLDQRLEKQKIESAKGRRSVFRSAPAGKKAAYLMTPRPPVNQRRVIRTFRPLQRSVRTGALTEPDIPATIAHVCREGFLTRTVFQSRCRHHSVLRVLVDYGGSMTPFSPALNPVLDALKAEGEAGRIQVRFFYFHDSPKYGLFETPNLSKPVNPDFFFTARAVGFSALIISDAGAARGDYDGRRIRATELFLNRLNRLTPRIAWINPVPPNRWKSSSAGDIAGRISMFPLSRHGLEYAAAVLRGGEAFS